jgi:hypothetical protein
VNDSGGGVFVNVGGTWELTGLLDTVNEFEGQPTPSSTVDNSTFAIDLASYSPEIQNAIGIPEPSVGALLALAPLAFTRGRRRQTS